MKEAKGTKCTLIVMSSEKYIELLSHVVHMELIYCWSIVLELQKKKREHGSQEAHRQKFKLFQYK